MKLKPIPNYAIVHTPTEAEAKELLAILHENGYKWSGNSKYNLLDRHYWNTDDMCYIIKPYKTIAGWNTRFSLSVHSFEKPIFLTFAEFKEWYCEEEKNQPKFSKGDMVVYNGKPYLVEAVTNMGGYYLYSIDTEECDHLAALPASELEPYTGRMNWQQEQKKYILQICYAPLLPDDIKLQAQQTVMANLQFRTTADRDKCIEEINAIVEKYSMK